MARCLTLLLGSHKMTVYNSKISAGTKKPPVGGL